MTANNFNNFFSIKSSIPPLGEGAEEEIVIFDQTEAVEIYDSDYQDESDGDFQGYTRSELNQEVTFVRSSKDPQTGDFYREKKDLSWVLQNGCEEAERGVWSGAWYFTYLFGEKEGKMAWLESMNKRLAKESGGKAIKFDHNEFCNMLRLKAKGNRAFQRGQYKSALDSYLKAEKTLGGEVSGMYLVPHQRAELVKVLSNQAECYLRMNKFEDAIVQATAALKLDKRHGKSRLRRAKGLVYGADRLNTLNSMIASRAAEDLQVIMQMNGGECAEAHSLMNEIDAKMNPIILQQ